MDKKVTLFGASGHGKVIITILESQGIEIGIVLDDNPCLTQVLSYPILKQEEVEKSTIDNVIFSIGNNKTRKKLAKEWNCNFAKAIHPSAIISSYSTIEEGTVVMAGVIINPDSKIGKHCIINTGAVIEHDCQIEDFVHVSPNVSLAGNVTIREGAHVGIGATVIQGITIGKWATIGAGSTIIKDVPDYAVVVGNPGKIIKYIEADE